MNCLCSNMEKREAQKNVEALIAQAVRCPSEELRDQLIDLEIDGLGVWRGFDLSNWYWHQIIPD